MKFGELLIASQMDDDIDPKKPKKGTRAYELYQTAKKKFGVDNLDSLTLAKNAVKNIPGVTAEMVLGSAFQEGMNKAVAKPDEVSTSYVKAQEKGLISNDFPVDAFYNYGIDKFSEYLPKIQKYLPENFQNQYTLYPASNETDERQWAKQVIPILQKKGLLGADFKPEYHGKGFYKTMKDVYAASDKYGSGLPEMGQSLQTGAFRNNQDAMTVKAAIIRDAMDEVEGHAKKKGYTLDEEAKNYFTLARYNSSPETSLAMLDEYAAAKDKKAFLQQGVYKNKYGKDVHANVSPRLENMQVAKELYLAENPLGNEPIVKPVIQ